MAVPDFIYQPLATQGSMPFVEFMQKVLYTPNEGYYSGQSQMFGEFGDFVTAPELTPLFGRALAIQCQQVLSLLEEPILFEFGAGSGKLCISLLKQLEEMDSLPQEYHILEISGPLKKRQQAEIEQQIPHLAHMIKWLDEFPGTAFNGIVIANEVLDAMPVHRFLQTEQGVLESMICLDDHGELVEQFWPTRDMRLKEHVSNVLSTDCTPYQSEANLFIGGWLAQCFTMLKSGLVLLVDYGFPQHEYYHPDRKTGTLMCHYQHKAHPNPLLYPGEQDITAHVDFTHVADAADQVGFSVSGYTQQAAFLVANGLLDLLEAIQDERERLAETQAVKRLLQPHEMGELFKVMALTKELATSLQGFQWHDKRGTL